MPRHPTVLADELKGVAVGNNCNEPASPKGSVYLQTEDLVHASEELVSVMRVELSEVGLINLSPGALNFITVKRQVKQRCYSRILAIH